jgi:chromatin remodeling complex protein RSC6
MNWCLSPDAHLYDCQQHHLTKNIQNPDDKRQILCDDKLKAVMGGSDSVTMFNMNRFITKHLLEKLDRSAYVHDDAHTTAGDNDNDEAESNEESTEEEDDSE